MQLKYLLGLAVLATAATLTLSAPTDVAEPVKETTADVKESTADVKESTLDAKEATAEVKGMTVGENDAVVKDSTADIKNVSVDAKKITDELKKGSDVPMVEAKDIETNKVTEKKVEESTNIVKDVTSSGETASTGNTNQLSLKDVIETVREKEENLVELEKQLKEAVSESVSSSSKPAEPDSPNKNKVGDIISQFINELVQIPMVLLHAISNAITSFTGNRIALSLNKSPPK